MLLKYDCVTLRAIETKDLDLLTEMMNNPEVDAYVGSIHLPVSKESQLKWIESYKNDDKTIRLMIELSNGKTIGMIMLQNIDYINKTAELGIKTYAKFEDRMKNDTISAYKAIISYAFDELNLNCIYSRVVEDNIFALKLNKKFGFIQEGLLRDRLYCKGKYNNIIVSSILKKDYTV